MTPAPISQPEGMIRQIAFGWIIAQRNCLEVQLRVGTSSWMTFRLGGRSGWVVKGGANDQVHCYCRLRLIGRTGSARHDARADPSARQHDHANRCRLRPRQDDGQWCLRGKNHHSPDAPRRPQVLRWQGGACVLYQ